MTDSSKRFHRKMIAFWGCLILAIGSFFLMAFLPPFTGYSFAERFSILLLIMIIQAGIALDTIITGITRHNINAWSILIMLSYYVMLIAFYVLAFIPYMWLAAVSTHGEFYGVTPDNYWPATVLYITVPPILWALIIRKSVNKIMLQALGE